MAFGRLPVMRAVRVAYGDVARVLRAMPTLVLVALAIDLAGDVLKDVEPLQRTAAVAFGTVIAMGKYWLLTPFFIAVHRFILIDEADDHYRLDPQNPRFARFFTWSLALWLMLALPGLAVRSLAVPFSMISPTTAMSALACLCVVAVIVGLRLIVLFPAIAVDAPGATPANASADMHGYALDVFLICVLAILPIVAVETAVVGAGAPSFAGQVVDTLANLVIRVLMIVVASRAFQSIGNRVLRPASA